MILLHNNFTWLYKIFQFIKMRNILHSIMLQHRYCSLVDPGKLNLSGLSVFHFRKNSHLLDRFTYPDETNSNSRFQLRSVPATQILRNHSQSSHHNSIRWTWMKMEHQHQSKCIIFNGGCFSFKYDVLIWSNICIEMFAWFFALEINLTMRIKHYYFFPEAQNFHRKMEKKSTYAHLALNAYISTFTLSKWIKLQLGANVFSNQYHFW